MGDSENKNEQKKPKTQNTAKKTSRFEGIKAEFKRIVWPTKEALLKETTAVVVATVILSVIIAVLDLAIKTGLDKILQLG